MAKPRTVADDVAAFLTRRNEPFARAARGRPSHPNVDMPGCFRDARRLKRRPIRRRARNGAMDGSCDHDAPRGLVERRVPLIAARSARTSPPAACADRRSSLAAALGWADAGASGKRPLVRKTQSPPEDRSPAANPRRVSGLSGSRTPEPKTQAPVSKRRKKRLFESLTCRTNGQPFELGCACVAKGLNARATERRSCGRCYQLS